MSSEMRELLKKYETRLANFERLYGYNEQAGADARWNRAHMLQCRDIVDDLRALLARTEVGADRPVAEISELSGAKLIVLYSADEIGHLQKGTKLYTHPQDAIGDAELSELRRVLNKLADYWIAITRDKDVAHRDRAIIDAYDKGLTKCATELRAAMQAKEAK